MVQESINYTVRADLLRGIQKDVLIVISRFHLADWILYLLMLRISYLIGS